MTNNKNFEKINSLLRELAKSHDQICDTVQLQKELQLPVDITNKLDFVLRTLKSAIDEIVTIKNTEIELWKETLSELTII